ncbi:MAG: class II aldolase/adducin family protein [[Clostridium] scindens]
MNEEIAKSRTGSLGRESLFERGKTAGSTANLSFRHEDASISASGTCFGTLKSEDFAVMDMDGNHVGGPAPSKEYPLHRLLYEKKDVGAVIHVHSFYATLWSCLKHRMKPT